MARRAIEGRIARSVHQHPFILILRAYFLFKPTGSGLKQQLFASCLGFSSKLLFTLLEPVYVLSDSGQCLSSDHLTPDYALLAWRVSEHSRYENSFAGKLCKWEYEIIYVFHSITLLEAVIAEFGDPSTQRVSRDWFRCPLLVSPGLRLVPGQASVFQRVDNTMH